MIPIEIQQLSKSFGENQVLIDISMQIKEGEIFGLLGPSGAGKTTLIKIVTGQLKATNGTVSLFEKDILKDKKEIMSQVGMVMDNSGLYERLTCKDNLEFYARIYQIPFSQIEGILEKVGLQDAKNLPVTKLSKGMRQRLLLARAILHKPKLLFLDEPTSGLDPAMAKEIHTLLENLKASGTTCFLTTHNMEEAYKLCDHIALLNEGHIVEYGVPQDICRKYNSENLIHILLSDGTEISLPNGKDGAQKIKDYLDNNSILTMHSSEPNLETVFIKLTGRGLI